MKKNGFTLVELLGVVFILALLGLLIVPVVSGIISQKKYDLYNVQIKNIEEGAQSYITEHIFEIDIPVNQSRGIQLGTLQNQGYVKNDIINPLTRKYFSSDTLIIITSTRDGFTYKVCATGVTCDDVTML